MEKQYREFAEECDRLAQEAKTDAHRKILEEMAKAWRMVAAESDQTFYRRSRGS